MTLLTNQIDFKQLPKMSESQKAWAVTCVTYLIHQGNLNEAEAIAGVNKEINLWIDEVLKLAKLDRKAAIDEIHSAKFDAEHYIHIDRFESDVLVKGVALAQKLFGSMFTKEPGFHHEMFGSRATPNGLRLVQKDNI